MKIILINASPKPKDSISGILIGRMKPCFSSETVVDELKLRKPEASETDALKLKDCDTWVLFFPLYVDGVPGHLLSCMAQIEKAKEEYGSKNIYAVMNCGFHEGFQNKHAMDMIKNWCIKSGFIWQGGLGIGAGSCLGSIAREGSTGGPIKPVDSALKRIADDIKLNIKRENDYISVGLPRFAYKAAAQLSWRKNIRANGGKAKDLARKPKGGESK